MPNPIDNHGGAKPSAFHAITKSDIENRVFLFIKSVEPKFNLDMFTNLLMNKVEHIFVIVEGDVNSMPRIHPHITFIPPQNIQTFFKTHFITEKMPHAFFTVLPNTTIVHPQFWELLEIARPGTNIRYFDENKKEYMLCSITNEGISAETIKWPIVAAYANWEADKDRNNRAVHHAIVQKASKRISELTIDTTGTFTPLCYLATKYMTDKSPFNIMTHRHPYTAVYDMFLRPFQRYDSLKMGEIGVLNGASVRMWREYFPMAELHGFDINEGCLNNLATIKNTKTHLVDAGNSTGLRDSLMDSVSDGKKFDILLEDASHWLEHQLIFIRDAIEFVNPGGIMIIEDIFREIPVARFQEAVDQISDKVQNAVMILPEHQYRHSPGWNNDRILIIWRR